jgi:hypothetical protein
VAIQVVHQHGISAVKGECHAPVAADPSWEVAFEFSALERMQTPAGQILGLGVCGHIQTPQHRRQARGATCLNARSGAVRKKGFQALVAEGLYHSRSESQRDTERGVFLLSRACHHRSMSAPHRHSAPVWNDPSTAVERERTTALMAVKP